MMKKFDVRTSISTVPASDEQTDRQKWYINIALSACWRAIKIVDNVLYA